MPPKSGRHHSPIVISSDSDEATRAVTPRADHSRYVPVRGLDKMTLMRQLTDMRAECDALRDKVERQTDELKEHKETYARLLNRAHSLLKCFICREQLENPFLLPECGHTYCESCLAKYFLAIEDRCPCCDTEITTPPVRDFMACEWLRLLGASKALKVDPKNMSWVGKWDKWFRPKAPADNRKVGGYHYL